MTDGEIYNLLMNSAKYREYLENDNYKRLFAEVCHGDYWETRPTPAELAKFLTAADIKIVQDGKIPPQAYKDSGTTSFNFSNINEVGTGAFMGSKLESADLRNVKSIQSYAFMNSDISEVNLPKNGKVFFGAFGHCQKLTELYIPPHTELAPRAFEACTNLEEVFIEEGRTDFPEGVFNGVKSLPIIYVPADKAVEALNMFASDIDMVRQYDHREGRSSYKPYHTSVVKKINIVMVIGPEDQSVKDNILNAIKNGALSALKVNNIRFTG